MTRQAPRSFANGAFVFLLALLAGLPARAACRVERLASVPVTVIGGGTLLVPVTINGMREDFVLDTGAERSVITPAAAEKVGLTRDAWVSADMQGVGGHNANRLGRPRSFSLGGIALRRRTMAADNSIAVATLASNVPAHPIAGLLGQDFLSNYDLDLDVRHGTLGVYDVSGCTGWFLPWPGHYSAIAAFRPVRDTLMLPVTINGHTMMAELDSGSARSVVLAPGMVQLGLAPGGGVTLRGLGAGSVTAHLQRFDTLRVGDETIPSVEMLVAPFHALRIVSVLLGADWLQARRVWISWTTDQVFVAAP